MKIQIILFAATIALLAGCSSVKTSKFIPVEGRFGYVTHVQGIVDQSMSQAICYQDTNGATTVVWPHLQMIWGNGFVVSNDTAVLVGGVAKLYPDGNERLTARLIAFKGPSGPPMDITDQVLQRYYAGTPYGLTNFMWDSFVALIKTNDAIQIPFSSDKIRPGTKDVWEPFDSTAIISWVEIEAIMNDVKKNGKFKTEKSSGFEYLQE